MLLRPHKGLKLDKRDVQDLTEVREMLATRIKQWEKEFIGKGREEGREEGRKEGRKEGELAGEAKTLKKMLTLKHGPLPEWAEQRIAQADAVDLEEWVEKLLTANSLDEIFN
jgi:predicted transposase YdaD